MYLQTDENEILQKQERAASEYRFQNGVGPNF